MRYTAAKPRRPASIPTSAHQDREHNLNATVTFENVSKRFGDVVAVDDLSLDIRDAEFMVLVGPSGCGKTTSLRMIAGLEEITSGVLARSANGSSTRSAEGPRHRHRCSRATPSTAYEHPRQPRVWPQAAARAQGPDRTRVKEAAAILDLTRYLDRKPRELSGGQRQRVALGERSCASPRSSSWMSRFPTSTPSCASRPRQHPAPAPAPKHTFVYVTHDRSRP